MALPMLPTNFWLVRGFAFFHKRMVVQANDIATHLATENIERRGEFQ
jgi:hypothetical protein